MRTWINKTILISFMMLWAFSLRAQNTMKIPNVSGNAKDTVEVSVNIDNTDAFVAFQSSLKLNTQLSYLEGSADLTARAVDHSISAGMVTGDTLRILAYSETGKAFSGNSGGVVTFSLILRTIPGAYSLNPSNAIIGDSNSHNILTGVINGQLTLYAPDINLNINTLNYTRTIVGSYSDMTFTILNNGNTTLTIDSLIAAPSSAYGVVPGWSTTVTASGSQVITVRFAPPYKGSFVGTVKAYSDDPDEPCLVINLSGTGYKVNELRVKDLSTSSDTDTTLSFRINNQEPFTGFQFDLALPSAMTYLANSEQLNDRANGHSVAANVVAGGKLRVVAYSSNNSTFNGTDGDIVKVGFHVEGIGGSYSLPLSDVIITNSISENILSDSYNGQLSIAAADIQSSTSINYGSVSILDAAQENLSIQNVGNEILQISSFTPNDVHFWTDVSLPININPSQQAVVPTYFHSSVKGTYTGKYTLRSNDPDEDPYNVSLAAVAYSPNIMKIENATGIIGGRVNIYVHIDNYDPFTAFQLDIDFPAPLSVILDSTQLTNRSQDHSLNKGLISGNMYRFFAYSSANTEFTGNSGPVLRILCNISGSAGSYGILIQQPIIGDTKGYNILSSSENGTLVLNDPVLTKINIFLEGPYSLSTNEMSIALIDNIPLTSPYNEDDRTVSRIPENITDWVLVQLRSTATGQAIASRSAFLHKDGRIVADDGTTGQITISAAEGNYFIVIKHRNHLAVMSNNAIALSSSSSTLYDFTTGSDKFYGSGGAKELESGVWGMWSGDIDQDKQITTSDYTLWYNSARAGESGYQITDINLDAQVTTSDYTIWYNNARAGASSSVP